MQQISISNWHETNVLAMCNKQALLIDMKATAHFNKVGMFGITDCHNGMHFFNQFLLLVVIKVHVPLCQPRLACTVLDQNESNLQQQTTDLAANTNIHWLCKWLIPKHIKYHMKVCKQTPWKQPPLCRRRSVQNPWKSMFSITLLSFDVPSPENSCEYPHKLYVARN